MLACQPCRGEHLQLLDESPPCGSTSQAQPTLAGALFGFNGDEFLAEKGTRLSQDVTFILLHAAHAPVPAGRAQRAAQVEVDKQQGWVPLVGPVLSSLLLGLCFPPRFLAHLQVSKGSVAEGGHPHPGFPEHYHC